MREREREKKKRIEIEMKRFSLIHSPNFLIVQVCYRVHLLSKS